MPATGRHRSRHFCFRHGYASFRRRRSASHSRTMVSGHRVQPGLNRTGFGNRPSRTHRQIDPRSTPNRAATSLSFRYIVFCILTFLFPGIKKPGYKLIFPARVTKCQNARHSYLGRPITDRVFARRLLLGWVAIIKIKKAVNKWLNLATIL